MSDVVRTLAAAIDRAGEGKLAEGYAALQAGLAQALERQSRGERGSDAAVARWCWACEWFAGRYGVQRARNEERAAMRGIGSELSPAALAAAIEESHAEFNMHLGRTPRVTMQDRPEMLMVLTSIPHPVFNGVFRARLEPDGLAERIAATLAPFRAAGVPMFWWVGPTTRPADLGAHLQAAGLDPPGSMPGMALDLRTLTEDSPPLAGLTVQPVADMATLRLWGEVVLRSFDMPAALLEPWLETYGPLGVEPPVRYYLACVDGQPVGGSLMLLGETVAGLFAVGTVPEARRRGVGAAVTRAPLREARDRGYRYAILSASSMGESVYRRLGFVEYCRLETYLGPGES
jgi:GNAT superfamily N-acetyltransferase